MTIINEDLRSNGRKQAGQVQDYLQLLPLIMNNIPQAVFWKDKDLVYLGCNRAFAEDAGFASPEDVVGKTDFDMPWKEQADLYRADDRLVMENGKPKLDYEEPQTTPNGSKIWLNTSKIPVYENDQVVAVLGMYEDITERKQAEEANKEERQRFRTILETIRVPTIISRLSDGEVIYANEALAQVSQVNLDKLIGFKTGNFYANPDDRKTVLASLREHGYINDFEVQFRRTDGSLYWALLSSRVVNYEGEPCVLSTYIDITERKHAEVAAQESRARFQGLVETLNDWIWEVDQNGAYTYVSPKIKDLLGYEPAEVLGKTPFDLMPSEEAQRVASVFGPLLSTQRPLVALENMNVHKDGHLVVFETSGTPFFDSNGNFGGYRGTDRDITERKQAEQFLRKSEATLSSALGVAQMGHWEFDIATQMFTFNDQYYSLHGTTAQEVGGYQMSVQKFAQEFVYPEDTPIVGQATQQAIETTDPDFHVQLEARIMHADGKPRWVTVWFRVEKDAQGRTIKLHGVNQDITERKQAEAELQQEKSLSDAIINGLPGIFYLFDTQGKMIKWNKQYEEVLGYTTEETASRTAIDPIAEEDREHTATAIGRVFTEGQATVEANVATKDGRRIPYYFAGQRLKIGDQLYVAGMGIDMTERKKAEKALADSESQLRSLFEQSADAILLIENGIFTDCNHATVRMMRAVNKEDFLSLHPSRLSPEYQPDGRLSGEKADEMMRIALEQGSNRFEWIHRRVDGTDFPVEVLLTSISTGNRHIIHTVWRDITERKRLQQAVQTAFERRGLQVQLSTQVSQSIAAAASLDELYERVVSQVKDQFGYYHTQLLRYDPAQEAVVLVTGYGEVGAKMLAAGHRLPMGEGLIGTAAAGGETVLRPTLESDPDWHPNPLLPETKGEIAVPIMLGNTILGVLDVQSNVAGALNTDDQLLLEGLCGQIATAIESTRLREEMSERLEEINRLYRAMSHEGWQTYQEITNIPSSFMFDQAGLRPAQDIDLTGELFANVPLVVPGGEVIGTLAIADDPERPMSPEDQAFLEQVAEQVALALESARLFEQTQGALVESEEAQKLIRNVIDSTDDWIFVKDQEHRYRLVNQGYAKALHIPVEEFIGKTDLDLGFPEELVKGNPEKGIRGFWSDDRLVMESGLPQHFPDDPATIDGQVHVFDTIKIPLRDASESIWGVLAFSRDVTERKLAEVTIAKRAAELATVAEVSTAAATTLDPDRLLQSVVDLTKERFGLYHAHIYLINPHENVLVLSAGSGEVGKQMLAEGWSIPVDHDSSIIADAYRKRQSVIANDVYHDRESAFLSNRLLPDTRSEMALPLVVGDQVLGVFDVQSEQVDYFTTENVNIYTTLASQVAVTLQNAGLFEQTQEALNWQQTINRTSIAIGQAKTIDDIVRGAAELLPLLGMLSCSVSLIKELDADGKPRLSDIHIVRFVDGQFTQMPPVLDQPTAGWLPDDPKYYQESRVTVFPNLENLETIVPSNAYKAEGAVAYMLKVGMRSAVALALGVRDRAIGYLTFTSRESLAHLPEQYIEWLAGVVDLISAAIDNQLLFEETKRQRAQLSEALKTSRLAYWEYDFVKDLFTFNDEFYAIFRTTAEREGGYTMPSAQYAQRFVHPDDLAIVGMEIQKSVDTTDPNYSVQMDHRVIFANGEIGYINVRFQIEKDAKGRTVRSYGANQDITERKRAEETIKAEQERTQTILESVTVPMVITRLSDNHLTFVNSPAMEVTQFQYEEVINQPSPNFYYNLEDRDKFITELRAKSRVSDMVVQLRRKSGEVFWALLSARVFNYQGEASILTTFLDITDRVRAEEAVAKRATELATVAEVSTTASTVLDPDQLLQAVVNLTKERFGLYHAHIYLADEAWNTLLLAAGAGEIGRKLVAEQHAIPMSLEHSLVARAARERRAIIVNDVNSEPGYLPNPLLLETCAEMAVPMIVGDKVLGVFDVQSNDPTGFSEQDANIYITLAAQVGVALQNARLYMGQAATLTQLRELDKLKSSFLANMSHELRTPLNSILGFTDVIMEGLDGPLTEHMDNDLRLIQKNGQHLLHLINDVLDMAKIEAGRMNLSPENFKAFDVMEEVTSITSTLASEKNLALFIDETSERDVEIYADRTRLRQVMINLVNNAIKFTEAGKISLKVVSMPGARILITVTDTGIGIAPDKLDAIFQEFTQVDASSTRKAGGTGLGLPISRRLVEMHGGRLWAESTGIPGEGSIFFVELPIEARISEVVEKQAS